MIKIYDCHSIGLDEILSREQENTSSVEKIVSDIIENVKTNKDSALFEYCEKFDRAKLSSLLVSNEEIDDAFESADEEFIRILKNAKENIELFHSHQIRNDFLITKEDGIVIGQKFIPIEKVGLYVPGGTASYPSSVLMNAVPAKLAGCREIVMVTPPSPDGKINENILVAAKIAGVDKIFKVGGAQAVAALAYGTESIPQVDKIVGPGNSFVAEAKKQVFGRVSIDMIAGPSEILIVADKTSDADILAADMLSQAEHDKCASAVLITDSKELALEVSAQLEIQLEKLQRRDIARASIDNNGKIIVCGDIKEAIDIANKIAPEHLELCLDNPFDYLDEVKNAGSIFLGKNCPEALGDYYAGPNHTLPTSGTARFSSPLSVDDFVKKSQFIYYTDTALNKVCDDVNYFAKKERLEAHGLSAISRKKKV